MKKPRKANVAVTIIVAACLAVATYIGIQGIISARAPGAADEAARKKAFEKAQAEGNLSFEEAKYWHRLEPPADEGTPP
ncbi:MAG TPA: hypothetical protein VMX79_08320 [bacterium]|nr:hypothetical protein [bacterium]